MKKTFAFQSIIASMQARERVGLINLGISLFFVLLSYPILRSTTTSLFLHHFGAQSSPYVWLYSVFAIMICVFLYDRFQKSHPLHQLFNATVLISIAIFLPGIYFLGLGYKIMAYFLFVWKEAYIVLLVHMIFGLANASLSLEEAKVFYGPLGALGSIGGIIGGLITGWLSYYFSSESILAIGVLFIFISAISFFYAKDLENRIEGKSISIDERERLKLKSPLMSLQGVGFYVLVLCLIIAASQFVINLANYKFDVLFAQLVPDKDLKTRYLGNLYTFVNTIGLLMQIFVIPFVLAKFSRKNVHFFIPILFLTLAVGGLMLGGAVLLMVAFSFGMMKGTDYSLFSAAKELMYFGLNNEQKYGAKYIVDMVVYRFSKGIISVFLIFYKEVWITDIMLCFCCLAWFVLIFPLFKIQKTMHPIEEA